MILMNARCIFLDYDKKSYINGMVTPEIGTKTMLRRRC